MNARGWTCRRISQSIICGHRNPPRTRKCQACGKPRPARRKPAHMRALQIPYAVYMAINGGEHCGICQRPRNGRRLCRDHDHGTGQPRGLLCPACNRALIHTRYGTHMTIEWLLAAAAYLQRTQPKQAA